MFRLDKRKIFLLYQYYLLGEVDETRLETSKDQEHHLQGKIAQNLKEVFAAYELVRAQNSSVRKMIIDQTVNF
ncbi:6644_t:CDS:2, partial [Racocetra fulgida]